MKIRSLISSILVFTQIFSLTGRAAFAHENCNDELHSQRPDEKHTEKFQIIPSGRDEDVAEDLKKASEEIFGKNGIGEKLGVSLPPHMIEFVPSGELNLLAALGRPSLPHWHDGAELAVNASKAGGVLEFVTPGCPTCRSFYSDTTNKPNQISILMHVAGHNDFAANSMYNRIRPSDPIADALQLYDLMDKLYAEYDHDEVSQWYQYLLSMQYMQDLAFGTYDSPESLKPNQQGTLNDGDLKRLIHVKEKNAYQNKNHPKAPTPSVLQAIVANLPSDTPKWKIEVATIFERMERVLGYYASTKIMNEGWATLMMQLMQEHYSGATSSYAYETAELFAGVVGNRLMLENPYSLGLKCWQMLRKKFNARPEVQGLAKLERDRQFVAYAHTLIQSMSDYDFLRYAMDEQFVADQGYFLKRKATPEEWENIPPPPPGKFQQPEQFVVVSTDHKKVIQFLSSVLADRGLQIPRVNLANFNYQGNGKILLVHEVRENIPLKLTLAVQSLYVLSQITKKTVGLKTIYLEAKSPPKPDWWPRWWWEQYNPPTFQLHNIYFEVEPNGKVYAESGKAYDPKKDAPQNDGLQGDEQNAPNRENAPLQFDADLTKALQEYVTVYREDINGSINDDLVRQQLLEPTIMATQIADHSIAGTMSLLSHSPTAAKAILEYYNMVELRVQKALDALIKSGKTPNTKKGSISLKVLPHIPSFQFDRKTWEKYLGSLPKTPVDIGTMLKLHGNPNESPSDDLRKLAFGHVQLAKIEGDLDLGEAGKGKQRKTGEKFWDEGKKNGNGDGEADDEDSDEDGDKPGDKPGGQDKSDEDSKYKIEIPIDKYADLLSEEVELPRLRPKQGMIQRFEPVREGGVHKPNGNVLYERMVPEAINYGKRAFRQRGIDPSKVSRNRLIKEGFKYIQPTDFVVSDHDPVPLPDTNAVLVVYLDMTGSMMAFNGVPIKRAKEFLWLTKVMLRRKYKNLEIRYVGMDTKASEFTEENFFKEFLGGGTDYSTGLILSREILETYPEEKWDRYSLGIGDAQDGRSDVSVNALHDLVAITQYSAFVRTDSNGGFEFFMGAVKALADSDPYFNWAEIGADKADAMAALKKLFGKQKQE